MIIADTGFWLALANRRDRFDLSAKQALEEIQEPLIYPSHMGFRESEVRLSCSRARRGDE